MPVRRGTPGAILFICCCLQILNNYVAQCDVDKRPLYNIAHMANTIREVNYYLNKGANAVEADVTFSEQGEPQLMHHGSPCHCFRLCNEREDIGAYLKYIREITSPASPRYRKDLSLLFLDLKVSHLPGHSKFRAGDLLADQLVSGLWKNGTNDSYINVVISIGHTTDSPVVTGFRETLIKREMMHLEEKIGWDVGLNDPVNEIGRTWRSLGVAARKWQGDGSSSCLGQLGGGGRLREAIGARDNNATFDKVYRWTVDLSSGMRYALRQGVDGMVTNHPERVAQVLAEPEFERKYRLASVLDDPWERVLLALPQRKPNPGLYPMHGRHQAPLFGWVGSLMELVSSLGSFVGDSVRWYFRSDEWAKAEVVGAF